MQQHNQPNRLINELSPYLLEHAHNPVDWYPWGDEALQLAKKLDKPLLISIGYAACHWCHVMERQSFTNQNIAQYMNNHFICIKIDREERPDLDKTYMDAVQLLTGSGGWPLHAFATPQGKPFYGGTYFPPDQWLHLMQQISNLWTNRRHDVNNQADGLTHHIQEADLAMIAQNDSPLSTIYNNELYTAWAPTIDFTYGGFNGSPKFVLPVAWEFLLQYHIHQKNQIARQAVQITLTQIYHGGLHDHLAGGFARYSVDSVWHVPHFEKMLYDNAQLLSLYAHAYQLSKNIEFLSAINQTVDFLNLWLKDTNNCFWSSVNADSEGVEGKFYVWTLDEINKTLPYELVMLTCQRYNITHEGNWEHGLNVLRIVKSNEELAAILKQPIEVIETRIDQTNKLLLTERNKRIKPTVDDKILTSWNALAIEGLVDAFFAIGNPSLINMATDAGKTLCNIAMDNNGHLFHNIKNNTPSTDGFLEDYAFTMSAFIKLYQATFDAQWLWHAHRLLHYVLNNFGSDSSPLFYFTSVTSKGLVVRKTEVMDNVTPSSNSVMAEVLLKMGTYFRNDTWIDHSLKMVEFVAGNSTKGGPYFANWNKVMGMHVHGLKEVVVSGNNAIGAVHQMAKNYLPATLFIDGNSNAFPISQNGETSSQLKIAICQNEVCLLPVSTPLEALALLTN